MSNNSGYFVPVSEVYPQASSTERSFYLPALTGIRAIAAYLVFWHHSTGFGSMLPNNQLLENIKNESYIGVSIFFVLSGFLLTLRYFDSAQLTGAWWRSYIINRIARIYPMFFILTLITLLMFANKNGYFDWILAFLNFTFLKGFFEVYVATGIHQAWTLTVEECFYFTAPVAFWLIRTRRLALWWQPLILLVTGIILVATISPLNLRGLFGLPGNYSFMLLFTFFGRATEFYVGIQFALLWRRIADSKPLMTGWRTSAGVGAVLLVMLGLAAVRGNAINGQLTTIGTVLNNLVLPFATATLFYGLLTERTWLGLLLASKPLQILGKSSYIFYLIHFGLINNWLLSVLGPTAPWLSFPSLVFISIGLYYGVEYPAHSWIRRTFGGKKEVLAG